MGRGADSTAVRPPAAPQRPLTTRLVAGLLAVLLLGALVGTAAIVTADDDAPEITTTTLPELSGAAGELVDLLGTKDEATYHARYTGSSPEAADVQIETWQRPPNVRQDSEITIEGQLARTSSFVIDADQVRCVRVTEATGWTCRPGGPADTDPLAAMRARLGQVDVEARDTTIGDHTVRCFQFTDDAATNELCLRTDDGIPVLVRAGESELRLIELDEDVDDGDFVPPAEVEDA